ncbi:hypothetical protein [Candidatus Aalborgicola defluviihabitans]|uniref:hypothetical protein n=1 Tax=Candidatus Aalborgicola defluviihabitans TaxID=3386187 RepID=UPI001EB572C6|nr:hypothetical protein [Burkholderiales bacterium]
MARRLVIPGDHALLVGDVITLLRTAPFIRAVTGTNGRTHEQAGGGTGSRVVVPASAGG